MERFGAWQAESEKQTPDLGGTVKKPFHGKGVLKIF